MNKKYFLFPIKSLDSKVGGLTVIENILESDMSDFKRIYILHNSHYNISRGNHAHKRLVQNIICISGSCKLFLHDGYHHETFEMKAGQNYGIHINPGVWRTIEGSSPDCVLVVFASEDYDANDYIYTFDDFLTWTVNN